MKTKTTKTTKTRKTTKTVQRVAPVPRTVRGALNQIERFLERNNNESAQLWDILAALRGPDNSNIEDKLFTVRVRRAAFPRLIENNERLPASFWGASPEGRLPQTTSEHFNSHIFEAFQALGLK